MSITDGSRLLSLGNLEKILEPLPEPTKVEIDLYGPFDFSSVSRQVEEIIPGTRIRSPGGITLYVLEVQDPSKESILKSYMGNCRDREGRITKPEEIERLSKEKRIHFRGAYWSLFDVKECKPIPESIVEITINPYRVNISHHENGCPEYVEKLKKAVLGTGVEVIVKTHNSR